MIDIQSLTIGSHILYKGKRVEVFDINGYAIGHSGDNISHDAEDFDPIPITEELLTELGFRYATPRYPDKRYYKELDNKFYIIYNLESNMANIGQNDTLPYLHDWGFVFAEYLHTLEAFVYLTTKQRLI